MNLAVEIKLHLAEAPVLAAAAEPGTVLWIAKGYTLVDAGGCSINSALYRTAVVALILGTKGLGDTLGQLIALLQTTHDECTRL